MILTRADGKSIFMGYGWIVEDPLPGAPAEARASVTYGGVTRHVRQSLDEIMEKIIENAHIEARTALKPEPQTYDEWLAKVVGKYSRGSGKDTDDAEPP
jgi:hypothetical protein